MSEKYTYRLIYISNVRKIIQHSKISLKNVKGIAIKDVKDLEEKLINEAKRSLGKECIMELCHLVEEFLCEINKPPSVSFHEDMLLRKAAAETEQERRRADSEQKELEEIEEMQKMRKENLQWKEAENIEKNLATTYIHASNVHIIDDIDGGRWRIATSKLIERNLATSFCEEKFATELSTDSEILLTEWTFKYDLGRRNDLKKNACTDVFLKKLNVLEEKFRILLKLNRMHQSIVPYTFFAINRKSATRNKLDVRILYGQKIASGEVNLCKEYARIFRTQPGLVRNLALHLVHSIEWLHENRLNHGNITMSCMWYSAEGHKFRLSDCIIRPYISDLCEVLPEYASFARKFRYCSLDVADSNKQDLLGMADIFGSIQTEISNNGVKSTLACFISTIKSAKSIDRVLENDFIDRDVLSSEFDVDSEPRIDFRAAAHSRLKNEFVYVRFLGKGGFGDVLLAKNKLDGNEYAIKRIPLNSEDDRLNQKITREAKLFSRLSHPNVVRYYSAWIEHGAMKEEKTNTISTVSGANIDDMEDSLMPSNIKNLESKFKTNIPESNVEWTTSFLVTSKQSSGSGSTTSDEFDQPIRTIFSSARSKLEESEFLFFEDCKNPSIEEISYSTDEKSEGQPSIPSILFIQMEFCAKATLRTLIDSSRLYKNAKLIWKIFRELLLGLQYIHGEGMIHRDVKPMNILIDEYDHVKIGDFGLATRDFLIRMTDLGDASKKCGSLTKDVGTVFYVAPELLPDSPVDVDFTAKIDVFSLGIVLFEMFYTPLLPGMERAKVLEELRISRTLPSDFGASVPEVHRNIAVELIKSMLSLSSDKRPSVQDILESDRIPFSDVEESEFQRMFCQTLRSHGRMYFWILDTMFSQPHSSAVDYLFDDRLRSSDNTSLSHLYTVECIRQKLSHICYLHAFLPLASQLLVPFKGNSSSNGSSNSHICRLIDENGICVALPHDMRKSFARYCVRTGANRLKQYNFTRIYNRSDTADGTHPIERQVFGMDCVGPKTSANLLTSDLLSVVIGASKFISEISSNKWQIHIGHCGLILGCAFHIGLNDRVTQEKIMNTLYAIWISNKPLSREQRLKRLQECCEITPKQVNTLISLLEGDDCSFENMCKRFKPLSESRFDNVCENIRDAISDIRNCTEILRLLVGDDVDKIVFNGSLCYRPQVFSSGIVFQLKMSVPSKSCTKNVVVCAGGRYDQLLVQQRRAHDPEPPSVLCAVGCSFAMDALTQFCIGSSAWSKSWCSALICISSASNLKYSVELALKLRENQIAVDILHDPVDACNYAEIQDHCKQMEIAFAVVVIGDNDTLVLDGVSSYQMSFDNVLERLLSRKRSPQVGDKERVERNPISYSSSASSSNLNIHFAISERPSSNLKKRIENQVRFCLKKVAPLFASSTVIDVLVNDLPVDAVKHLSASIDRSSNKLDVDLRESLTVIALQFRCKKDAKLIEELLEVILNSKNNNVVALFTRREANGYFKFVL